MAYSKIAPCVTLEILIYLMPIRRKSAMTNWFLRGLSAVVLAVYCAIIAAYIPAVLYQDESLMPDYLAPAAPPRAPGVEVAEVPNGLIPHLAPDPEEAIAALGAALRALPPAEIFVIAPKTMEVGDLRKVDAFVGLDLPEDELRQSVMPSEQTRQGTLQVSSKMSATLTGPGFRITATTPEEQAIAEGFYTNWRWNIEAIQDGEQPLTITLYALTPSGGGPIHSRVKSYDTVVSVSIQPRPWGKWLSDIAQRADTLSALVVSVGSAATVMLGWLAFYRRRRRRAVNPGNETARGYNPQKLRKAIENAFDFESFELALGDVGRNIYDVGTKQGFGSTVHAILRRARKEGWLEDLLIQLKAERPEREDFCAAMDEALATLSVEQLGPGSPSSARFGVRRASPAT